MAEVAERVDAAVIGGGVTGLATAYRLRALGVEARVLEATTWVGGMCRDVPVGDVTLPAGPDAFLARLPWAVDLAKELGLELVEPRASGQYLWTETGLVPFPTGTAFGIPGDLGDAFRWPGLSRAGRRRALGDLFLRKRRDEGDESLGALLRRRLGNEATDRSLAPLLGGLFAGDVDELSVRATFPELQGWEGSQGSLLRGAQAASRNGRRNPGGPMFRRPRGGVAELPAVLAASLGDAVRTDVRVTELEAVSRRWRARTAAGSLEADAVVCTQDAEGIAGLLPPGDARALLEAIPFVGIGVVLLVYPSGTAEDLPDGSGFVVPRGVAPMTSCTWLSRKWPEPAFGDRAVLSCQIGGAGFEDVLDAADPELVEACARHLTALLPLPAAPEHAAIVRWPRAMPQYRVGHLDRTKEIRNSLPAGIFVTGRSLDGVGISDCVRAAGDAAEAVAAYLAEEAHR